MNAFFASPPMALLAELTHRCPLRCLYCSNPLELQSASAELETEGWLSVLEQAAALGVLQVHFSGGEPLVRRDLPALIRHAASLQLYTNLITSGIQLTQPVLEGLLEAGIDHIQLSFQDAEPGPAERIGGLAGAQPRKLEAARLIRETGLPLTLNFVVHRQNLSRLPQMLELAEQLGASRVEVAHTQFYGWGLLNRDALMPSLEQLDLATEQVEAARLRLAGRMVIDYVVSDYHAGLPKPCMGGWAQRFIIVSPEGKALPCHAAQAIPGMVFPSVRTARLDDIWRDDPAFMRFRGTDWMPEPCRGCERREVDWGGCRCQALLLTGDAAAVDPVCTLSPDRSVVDDAVRAARDDAPSIYRGARLDAIRPRDLAAGGALDQGLSDQALLDEALAPL